ncbi:unnamed protein product [Ambrosiozyma monospora]|uniref:Unnamed protein product n=1 Tax=Ambrosiozyma monospora TaxID=43982 RepID=A0ACB5UAY2_AMBMO|nr:unnamed protein product [Ambrosiozyma monospora]
MVTGLNVININSTSNGNAGGLGSGFEASGHQAHGGLRRFANASTSGLRTFSTTSLHSMDMIADNVAQSRQASSYRAYMDFERIKQEISSEIRIEFYKAGQRVITADEPVPGLYYVIKGSLETSYYKKNSGEDLFPDANSNSQNHDHSKHDAPSKIEDEELLHTVSQGELSGYLSTLIGGSTKSFANVTAREDTYKLNERVG